MVFSILSCIFCPVLFCFLGGLEAVIVLCVVLLLCLFCVFYDPLYSFCYSLDVRHGYYGFVVVLGFLCVNFFELNFSFCTFSYSGNQLTMRIL